METGSTSASPSKVCTYCNLNYEIPENEHLTYCMAATLCTICNVHVPRVHIKMHQIDCGRNRVSCMFCGLFLQEDLNEKHLQECRKAVRCKHCLKYFTCEEIHAHIEECRKPIIVDEWPQTALPSKILELVCRSCGQRFSNGMFSTHITTQCSKRQIQCKYCNQSMSADSESSHVSQCLSAWKCPKCHEVVSMMDRNKHMETCGREVTTEPAAEVTIQILCEICNVMIDSRSRDYTAFDDHTLAHSLQEPVPQYQRATESSTVRKVVAQRHEEAPVVRMMRCQYCFQDYPHDQLPAHQVKCPQTYHCGKCGGFVALRKATEHQRTCNPVENSEERPQGLRLLLPGKQRPVTTPTLKRSPEESKAPPQLVYPCWQKVATYAEFDDHLLGHQIQQESLLRQTEERSRRLADIHRMRQSVNTAVQLQSAHTAVQRRSYTIAQRGDDFFSSPESYEVQCIQELLKLDGDRYARGKGLKAEGLSLLPAYRYKGHPTECAICKEDITAEQMVKALPCTHVFHDQCIDEWIVRVPKCPVDNTEINLGR